MQINDLPSEIILHIESYINDTTLLQNLIFVSKYFRKIFIGILNNNILNGNNKPYNSYTYYASDVKEQIYQDEKKIYKIGYTESVMYNDIKIGWIERNETSSYYNSSNFNYPNVIENWRSYCYITNNKYNLNDFYIKQFRNRKNLDIHHCQAYYNNNIKIELTWYNITHAANLSIEYFTKEMVIEQLIYHYNQLSK